LKFVYVKSNELLQVTSHGMKTTSLKA